VSLDLYTDCPPKDSCSADVSKNLDGVNSVVNNVYNNTYKSTSDNATQLLVVYKSLEKTVKKLLRQNDKLIAGIFGFLQQTIQVGVSENGGTLATINNTVTQDQGYETTYNVQNVQTVTTQPPPPPPASQAAAGQQPPGSPPIVGGSPQSSNGCYPTASDAISDIVQLVTAANGGGVDLVLKAGIAAILANVCPPSPSSSQPSVERFPQDPGADPTTFKFAPDDLAWKQQALAFWGPALQAWNDAATVGDYLKIIPVVGNSNVPWKADK
jgi:hypothetical protein